MVLPGGIEPTTSPLPRECSTTELRQRRLRETRADTCHRWHRFATPSLDGGAARAENSVMSEQKQAQERRKQRLAKALKANMAKRKAQARAKTAAIPPSPEKPLKD